MDMYASDLLRADIEDDLVGASTHPFFLEMAAGTLPREVFQRFLEEDARFLDCQTRHFARLASCAPDESLFGPLVGLAAGLKGALSMVYVPVLARFGSSLEVAFAHSLEPYTEVYVRSLASYVSDAPFLEGVAAELSVLTHHEVVGDRLRMSFPELSDTDYGRWIRDWGANPAFRNALMSLRAGFNALAEREGEHALFGARRANRIISRFELLYWDAFIGGAGAACGEVFPRPLFTGLREYPSYGAR